MWQQILGGRMETATVGGIFGIRISETNDTVFPHKLVIAFFSGEIITRAQCSTIEEAKAKAKNVLLLYIEGLEQEARGLK